MSFGFSAAALWAIAGGTAAYVGDQQKTGEEAGNRQKAAQAQALKSASTQADLADQANNAANQRKPNAQNLLSDNAMAAKGGISGTMLTGPTGIDSKNLMLGKTTLLGM